MAPSWQFEAGDITCAWFPVINFLYNNEYEEMLYLKQDRNEHLQQIQEVIISSAACRSRFAKVIYWTLSTEDLKDTMQRRSTQGHDLL